MVELVLQANGEYAAAKAYILYRAEHARLRRERAVPAEVKEAFAEADAYFPHPSSSSSSTTSTPVSTTIWAVARPG